LLRKRHENNGQHETRGKTVSDSHGDELTELYLKTDGNAGNAELSELLN
jgi:hypothetical protein